MPDGGLAAASRPSSPTQIACPGMFIKKLTYGWTTVSGGCCSIPAAESRPRAVAPARAFPIRDQKLSARGRDNVDTWLADLRPTTYECMPLGGWTKL